MTMPLRKRLPRSTITPEQRGQIRAISDRMGDLVEEMAEINARTDATRDRRQRQALWSELCAKGEQVVDLFWQYRAIRHPEKTNRMAELRSLSGDLDLDRR